MNKRLWGVAMMAAALTACDGEEPASIGAIHHEVEAVSDIAGKLIVTVRARSGATDQSYWLPHIAGVARQVLAETSERWPQKLAQGVVFQVETTRGKAGAPALDLAFGARAATETNWRKVSDFAALDGATIGAVAPEGGRAIRAFCDDPSQARYAPTFCVQAVARGR